MKNFKDVFKFIISYILTFIIISFKFLKVKISNKLKKINDMFQISTAPASISKQTSKVIKKLFCATIIKFKTLLSPVWVYFGNLFLWICKIQNSQIDYKIYDVFQIQLFFLLLVNVLVKLAKLTFCAIMIKF